MNTELQSYIAQQRSQGVSDADIQSGLKNSGWKESDYASAFSKSFPVKPIVIGAISLIVVASIVGYAVLKNNKPSEVPLAEITSQNTSTPQSSASSDLQGRDCESFLKASEISAIYGGVVTVDSKFKDGADPELICHYKSQFGIFILTIHKSIPSIAFDMYCNESASKEDVGGVVPISDPPHSCISNLGIGAGDFNGYFFTTGISGSVDSNMTFTKDQLVSVLKALYQNTR